jgi:hypothetical protein
MAQLVRIHNNREIPESLVYEIEHHRTRWRVASIQHDAGLQVHPGDEEAARFVTKRETFGSFWQSLA